jgi:hypothetical protein
MKTFGLILTIVALVGCSGISNVSYPLADGTFKNQRTVSDPHAFAPTQARSWLETCQPKAENPKEPDYTRCSDAVDPRYATVSGFADGIGAAMVHSAGFVGGMYLLGQGIGDSGSQTTNTTTGGSATGGGANAAASSSARSSVQQHNFGGRR